MLEKISAVGIVVNIIGLLYILFLSVFKDSDRRFNVKTLIHFRYVLIFLILVSLVCVTVSVFVSLSALFVPVICFFSVVWLYIQNRWNITRLSKIK